MEKEFLNGLYSNIDFSYLKFNNDDLTNFHIMNMLLKTQIMFKYNNIPNTIPIKSIELNAQIRGYVGIIKHNDIYYATIGGIGAGLDFNYLPKKFIVNNPYIDNGLNKEYDIYYGYDFQKSNKLDNYCIVLRNDPFYRGLVPINKYYATFDTINDMSLKMVLINSRAQNIFTANDNTVANSIKDFIKGLENGDLSQINTKTDFIETLKTLPFTTSANSTALIRELIEHKQYNRAIWFNELGLQANYNMKRESLNSNENQLNEDSIIPLTDIMLETRKYDINLANELWGTDWKVDFSSVWKLKKKERDNEIRIQEQEINQSNKLDNTQEDIESNKLDNIEDKRGKRQ